MRCYYCDHEISDEATFCPYCGRKVSFDQEPKKKNNKNKFVWIGLVCFFAVLLGVHFQLNKNSNSKDISYYDYKKIAGNYITSQKDTLSNLVNGGYVCFDQDTIYLSDISNQQNIYKYDASMEKGELLVDRQASYLQCYDQGLIYKDESNQGYVYYYDLTTKQSRCILEKDAYYLLVYKDLLYYQDDKNQESLHVYDLKNETDQKLNDEATYHIQILDNQLYYSTDHQIHRYNLENGQDEVLLDASCYNLIVEKGNCYYVSTEDYFIYRYDLLSQKSTRLNREQTLGFVMNEDQIYYLNNYGEVINMNTDGLNNQLLNDEITATKIQILGDYLLIQTQGSNQDDYWTIIDVNGEFVQSINEDDSFSNTYI